VTDRKPTQKLDPTLVERIRTRAKQEEISVSDLIERAMHFYLDNPNTPSVFVKSSEIDGRIVEAIAPLRREVAMLRAELSEYGVQSPKERLIYSPQRLKPEMYND
jgi:hypothetical protein